jgi:hypothetical protein
MFSLESVWPKRRVERVIVPKTNYPENCIVSYISKRIGLDLKNKISFPFQNQIGYNQWVCQNTYCSIIDRFMGYQWVLSDATH